MTDLSSKELLVEAATTLFSEKGFDGVSVKEIAEKAKVNISLISYHFSGKEGLYRACFEYFGKERLLRSQNLLTPSSSKEEFKVKLTLFIEELIRVHLEDPQRCHLIHQECNQFNPILEDLFKNLFMKIFYTLLDFMKDAQKKKFVRKEVDIEPATILFFGSVMDACRSDRIREKRIGKEFSFSSSKKFRQDFIKCVMDVYLNGVST